MATEYTPNENLYKWKTTDSKQTTIQEMSSNAVKIDAKLNDHTAQLADIVQVNVENFPIQTPETNDTARINRAIASFGGKSGKLLFPRPLYTVSSDINVAIDNLIIEGNGFSTKIQCNNDSRIFYITGAYVTIKNMTLLVTSTNRTKFTCESMNSVKTMYKDVTFANDGESLSGIYFNGGSMGLVENCMLNHSRINVETWDVKIDKCYIWALSQIYGIRGGNAVGNLTITNTDIVAPLTTTVGAKAGLFIDSSNGACSNIKFIGGYFDGNPTLQTGVGCLITEGSFDITLYDFSSNKMNSDVIVIDSAFSVTVKGGKFINNNKSGTGSRDIVVRKTGASYTENILICENQFLQTSAVVGTVAPAVEIDDNASAVVINNLIKQPGAGGGYTDVEIKAPIGTKLTGNMGSRSVYRGSGSIAIENGAVATQIVIGGGVYPMAYNPPLNKFKFNTTGFDLPPHGWSPIGNDQVYIGFNEPTTSAGTLYWEVDL